MKGRRIGQIDVSISEMETIKTMTQNNATRRQISEEVNRAPSTVWHYQKSLGLI